MRFIAFDLETTGTVPGVDQIVEIGAVRFVNGVPDAIFATLINPGIAMPEAASAVNGIKDAMLVGKPKVTDVLQPFTEFCGDDIMVAHNAPFDSQFLINDYKKHEIPCPRGLILDSCAMARKVLPGMANYKLGTLVQHLGLEPGGFHRAEADAHMCGQLFIKMINRISAGGVMPPIANLIALTGKPESRFPVIEKTPKQLGFLDI